MNGAQLVHWVYNHHTYTLYCITTKARLANMGRVFALHSYAHCVLYIMLTTGYTNSTERYLLLNAIYMKILYGVLLFIGVLGFALGAGYLLTTGLVWLALWCAETLGLYTFEGSVWVAGLLVYIVVVIIGMAFNRGNK